jgi:hypothetical protein
MLAVLDLEPSWNTFDGFFEQFFLLIDVIDAGKKLSKYTYCTLE